MCHNMLYNDVIIIIMFSQRAEKNRNTALVRPIIAHKNVWKRIGVAPRKYCFFFSLLMGLHHRHRHEKASYAANGHYTDARWWMSECMARQKRRLVSVRQPASEVDEWRGLSPKLVHLQPGGGVGQIFAYYGYETIRNPSNFGTDITVYLHPR